MAVYKYFLIYLCFWKHFVKKRITFEYPFCKSGRYGVRRVPTDSAQSDYFLESSAGWLETLALKTTFSEIWLAFVVKISRHLKRTNHWRLQQWNKGLWKCERVMGAMEIHLVIGVQSSKETTFAIDCRFWALQEIKLNNWIAIIGFIKRSLFLFSTLFKKEREKQIVSLSNNY